MLPVANPAAPHTVSIVMVAKTRHRLDRRSNLAVRLRWGGLRVPDARIAKSAKPTRNIPEFRSIIVGTANTLRARTRGIRRTHQLLEALKYEHQLFNLKGINLYILLPW